MKEALEKIETFKKKTASFDKSTTAEQVKQLLGEPLRKGARYWVDTNTYWTYFEYLDDSNYAAFEIVFSVKSTMGAIQEWHLQNRDHKGKAVRIY